MSTYFLQFNYMFLKMKSKIQKFFIICATLLPLVLNKKRGVILMKINYEIVKTLQYIDRQTEEIIIWTNNNILPYTKQLIKEFTTIETKEEITWAIVICTAILLFIFTIMIINKISKWKGFKYMILGFILYFILALIQYYE